MMSESQSGKLYLKQRCTKDVLGKESIAGIRLMTGQQNSNLIPKYLLSICYLPNIVSGLGVHK